MKVKFSEIGIENEAFSDIIFLKNQKLWLFFSQKTKSRYWGGFLIYNNQVIRFIDDFNFDQEIKKIEILNPYEAILHLSTNQLYLSLKNNYLEITFSKLENFKLTFDIKNIFDNNPQNRNINLNYLNSTCILVEESLSDNVSIKILIEADSPLKINNSWKEKNMDFDKKRNSPPYIWPIFDGIYGKIKNIKIKILYPEIETKNKEIVNYQENNIFLNFLLRRIESLNIIDYLPAGFPWFFENWYRDELLSFFFIKKFLKNDFFEQRIKFYLSNINEIWDKNKPTNFLKTSDTFLLLILNLPQIILKDYSLIIENIFKKWEKDFLSFNQDQLNLPPSSTWMDSLERKNAIEIMALYIKTLKKLSSINRNYSSKIKNWQNKIKKEIIYNQSDVNLIFVYLFLKDILNKKEWTFIFKKLLKENFVNWGGITTISKNNPSFIDEDDGELSKAYHQGNCWYLLNNLTGFCLQNLNRNYFRNEIIKIILSSLVDLLYDGALGWSSELSSAKERRSEGSLIQLWSLTSLTLLLTLFQNINIFLESLSNRHNIVTIKS